MKRLVCPGLCFTLSLVLVFGSLFSSFTLPNIAFAKIPTGGEGGSGSEGGED
jgi:hypothetical protein